MINTIWNWLNNTWLGHSVLSIFEVYSILIAYNIGKKVSRKVLRRD